MASCVPLSAAHRAAIKKMVAMKQYLHEVHTLLVLHHAVQNCSNQASLCTQVARRDAEPLSEGEEDVPAPAPAAAARPSTGEHSSFGWAHVMCLAEGHSMLSPCVHPETLASHLSCSEARVQSSVPRASARPQPVLPLASQAARATAHIWQDTRFCGVQQKRYGLCCMQGHPLHVPGAGLATHVCHDYEYSWRIVSSCLLQVQRLSRPTPQGRHLWRPPRQRRLQGQAPRAASRTRPRATACMGPCHQLALRQQQTACQLRQHLQVSAACAWGAAAGMCTTPVPDPVPCMQPAASMWRAIHTCRGVQDTRLPPPHMCPSPTQQLISVVRGRLEPGRQLDSPTA